jgi:hypothetical protein
MISLSRDPCRMAFLTLREPPLVLGLILENENAGINLPENAWKITIPR